MSSLTSGARGDVQSRPGCFGWVINEGEGPGPPRTGVCAWRCGAAGPRLVRRQADLRSRCQPTSSSATPGCTVYAQNASLLDALAAIDRQRRTTCSSRDLSVTPDESTPGARPAGRAIHRTVARHPRSAIGGSLQSEAAASRPREAHSGFTQPHTPPSRGIPTGAGRGRGPVVGDPLRGLRMLPE